MVGVVTAEGAGNAGGKTVTGKLGAACARHGKIRPNAIAHAMKNESGVGRGTGRRSISSAAEAVLLELEAPT